MELNAHIRKMIVEGNSVQHTASQLGVTMEHVNKVISTMTAEDYKISITTSIRVIQHTEKELFAAIDLYHRNPTLYNSQLVNNISTKYITQRAY